MIKWHLFCLTLITCCLPITPFKILLMVSNVNSHIFYFGELAKGLAKRNHAVTMLTGSTQKVPDSLKAAGISVETYHMDSLPFSANEQITRHIIMDMFNGSTWSKWRNIAKLRDIVVAESQLLFKDDQLLKRLHEAKYDYGVVDMSSTSFFYLSYKLGLPYATLGVDCNYWMYRLPWPSSYIIHPILSLCGLPDDMNFGIRALNAVIYSIFGAVQLFIPGASEVQKFVPERPPVNMLDIALNASLCIRMKGVSTETARPTLPNIINAPGLMGRPGGNLTGDLKHFVASADAGVIIVSFGSWIETLPLGVLNKITDAFTKVNFHVIFKFTGEIKRELPTRVNVLKWIPQNDLLAHKNVKLFITHCGISSLIEAIYHGVPMVAMPFGLDQPMNAGIVKDQGYGKVVNVMDFETEDLVDAIQEVLSGPYVKTIKRASDLMKDMPQGVTETAYWIEHVIKHGDRHLRPRGLDIPWYEYQQLDVMLFLGILFTLAFFICKKFCGVLCRCCCARCCRKNHGADEENKKRQ